MAEVARKAGITREALYKSLSEAGDPKLSTLLGVTRALASHYPPVPPPGTDPPWP